MKFKLFISDFDGTLGKSPKNLIDEQTVKAIDEYVKKGGIFAVCTGRQFASIGPICKRHNISGIVICYQGAMIKDVETGKDVLIDGIDYQTGIDIVERFRKEDVQIIVDIDDKMYYDKASQYTDRFEQGTGVKGNLVDDVIEIINQKKRKLQKVCIMCPPEKAKALTEKYNEFYGGKILFNNGEPFLIDAINPAFSKEFAVKYLADYYNVPYEQILTVGDSSNDVGLVSGAWYGVAVGDGCDEVKAAAKEITVPFDKQPVLTLLKKYCLD